MTTDFTFTSDITVRKIDSMGDDARIAMAAWVATSAGEGIDRAVKNPQDIPGIINYLMKHRHGTPFEHSTLQFFVQAPIFVWREWHRHRIGFSYNETSARYSELKPIFYIPPRDRPMMKVDNWKPGRPKFGYCQDDNTHDIICAKLRGVYKIAYQNYQDLLSLNIDPGLARDCLPVGIYSSCWVTCNPRSLMAFLSLRTHEPDSKFVSYPLYEIEVAARACEEILKSGWPITHQAFCDNGRVAP